MCSLLSEVNASRRDKKRKSAQINGALLKLLQLPTQPIRAKPLRPSRETGFTASGETIHRLSKRVTSLPDAPFLQTGEGFLGLARAGSQCRRAGHRLPVLRTASLPPHSVGPLPSVLTPPLPPTPRLPALTDFDSVPCPPLRFSRISQGRHYSLLPSLRTRRLHPDYRQFAQRAPPRSAPSTPQSVPTKGPKT